MSKFSLFNDLDTTAFHLSLFNYTYTWFRRTLKASFQPVLDLICFYPPLSVNCFDSCCVFLRKKPTQAAGIQRLQSNLNVSQQRGKYIY